MTNPQLERMGSGRHNTKQIRLIQSSEEWGLYHSVGERLVLNEPHDVGGSVPEAGADKPRCYGASCPLNSSPEPDHWWETHSAKFSPRAGAVTGSDPGNSRVALEKDPGFWVFP